MASLLENGWWRRKGVLLLAVMLLPLLLMAWADLKMPFAALSVWRTRVLRATALFVRWLQAPARRPSASSVGVYTLRLLPVETLHRRLRAAGCP
jgi:hypothetical protein